MAKVDFLETTSAKLASLPKVNGRFVFTTDTKILYRETSTERCQVSQSINISYDSANNQLNITY